MRVAMPPGTPAAPAAALGAAAPPALRSNFAWTLAGNVVYAGCQWGILVVVAKLSSPESLGALALGYAITAPVFLLAGLHLRASQATDAAGTFAFPDCLAVRIAGMALALAVTAGFLLLSRYDAPTRLVVLGVAASKAVEGLSDAYYGVLQQHERMRPIAVSLVWRGLGSLLAVGAALAAGGGLPLALAALTVSWVAVLVLHDVPAAALLAGGAGRERRRPDGRSVARLVAIGVPLGLVIMLVSLRTNVPRYFIEHGVGAAELGVFAALSSLMTAGNVVVSALGQSAVPRLARHFHRGELGAFRRLLARLLAIAAAVGVAGLVVSAAAGRPLLLLLFGEPYARRADVLVALMGVGLLAYAASFLGYGVTSARRFAIQLPLFATTTLACAGASLWLVPAHGLVGAAAAWGASLLLELIALWVILEAALRRRAKGGAS
jgi:O-antigen/teichoic acid export membrane protein